MAVVGSAICAAMNLGAAGCLSAPSPPAGATDADLEPPRDAAAPDGDAGDAAPRACPGTSTDALDIDFADASQLDEWHESMTAGCSMTVQEGVLRFEQIGGAALCRTFADLGLDLVGRSLSIRVANPGAASLTFSLVLDEPGLFDRRTWHFFEKEGGMFYHGTCEPTETSLSCAATDATPFSAEAHSQWRFRHDAERDELVLETRGSDGQNYALLATVPDVPADLVDCSGIDLGSYQKSDGPSGTSAFDDLRAE